MMNLAVDYLGTIIANCYQLDHAYLTRDVPFQTNLPRHLQRRVVVLREKVLRQHAQDPVKLWSRIIHAKAVCTFEVQHIAAAQPSSSAGPSSEAPQLFPLELCELDEFVIRVGADLEEVRAVAVAMLGRRSIDDESGTSNSMYPIMQPLSGELSRHTPVSCVVPMHSRRGRDVFERADHRLLTGQHSASGGQDVPGAPSLRSSPCHVGTASSGKSLSHPLLDLNF